MSARVDRILAIAAGVTTLGMLVAYALPLFDEPRAVIDDLWGLVRYPGSGSFARDLADQWTHPAYGIGGLQNHGAPWGPLATTLQRLVDIAVPGRAIWPFRLLNVVVFAGALLALVALLRRVGAPVGVAAVAAATVAVHPLSAETVPWASDLFDVLGVAVLLAGAWVAAGRTGRAFPLAVFAATLLAGLAKPTMTVLFPVFVALALAQGRPRREVFGAAVAGLGGLLVHQAWYAAVVGSASPLVALWDRLGEAAVREALVVHLGAQLANTSVVVTPSIFRFVYLPDTAAPALSATGFGVALGALLPALAIRATDPRTATAGRIWLVGWLTWLVGNLPGLVFGLVGGVVGARYVHAPVVVLVACGGLATAHALGGRLPQQPDANAEGAVATRRVNAGAAAVLLLGIAAWMPASLLRIPDWSEWGPLGAAEKIGYETWSPEEPLVAEMEVVYRKLLLFGIVFEGDAAKPAPKSILEDPCASVLQWENAVRHVEEARARRAVFADVRDERAQIAKARGELDAMGLLAEPACHAKSLAALRGSSPP